MLVKILIGWAVLCILFTWGWARFWSRPCMQDMKGDE